MSNLSAKFVSAVLLGTIAGAASTALLPSTARAASDCLLEPRDDTPQGKHWHYRIERGSGRHCWYLRGEDEKAAEAPSADPAGKTAARSAEASTSRSIADAHAEIAPRTRMPGDAPATRPAPSVLPNPAVAAPATPSDKANAPVAAPSPLASRWPQASDATPSANAQPEATLMVADATDPDASNTQDPPAEAAPPSSLAAAPMERNAGSIQKLVLVAAAALALAGLTGSAVYRLGRRRKRNEWLRERTSWESIEKRQNPPWVESRIVPDLDEVRHAAAHSDVSHAFEADESGDRVEKIEEFLARFTQQLHAELENKPRAEQDARAAS